MKKANRILQKYWGYDELRPAQVKPIQAILEGKDVLGVMPTGYGKSICFQIPALILPGTTIVFSPLISLMKDQVDKLQSKGISAEFINSSLDDKQTKEVFQDVANGKVKILYVAPERLRSKKFLSLLSDIKVSMVTIDEAHAVSEWGHQFRPFYRRIPRTYDYIKGDFVISGFTATATSFIREDIIAGLRMRDPIVHVSGFARPNIRLSTHEIRSRSRDAIESEKVELCDSMIRGEEGGKIIYCGSKLFCNSLYVELNRRGFESVIMYHADMDAQQRKLAQDRFMAKDNTVCVATSAFGMGIDRPDIRQVIFSYTPLTINDLYQGIGRAGRDGLPSEGLLIHSCNDRYLQDYFIETTTPSMDVISAVYNFIVLRGKRSKNGNKVLITKYVDIASSLRIKDSEVSAALGVLKRRFKIASVDSKRPFIVKAKKPLKNYEASNNVNRIIASKLVKPTVKLYPADFGMRRGDLLKHLNGMANAGLIDFDDIGSSIIYLKRGFDEIPEEAIQAYTAFRNYRLKEAAKVLRYPFSGCRQRFILNYYGDRSKVEYCNCDFCKPEGDEL